MRIANGSTRMATSNPAPSLNDIALVVANGPQRLQTAGRRNVASFLLVNAMLGRIAERRPTAVRKPGAPHRRTEPHFPTSEVTIHVTPRRRCGRSVTISPMAGYTNGS